MSDETTDLTALLAEALSRGTSGRYFLDYGVTPAHLAEQITAAGFGPVRAVEAERDALKQQVLDEWADLVGRVTSAEARAESAEAALAGLREGIAVAMSEEFAERVRWSDGTEYIAVSDAQRIAREFAPTPDREEARDE